MAGRVVFGVHRAAVFCPGRECAPVAGLVCPRQYAKCLSAVPRVQPGLVPGSVGLSGPDRALHRSCRPVAPMERFLSRLDIGHPGQRGDGAAVAGCASAGSHAQHRHGHVLACAAFLGRAWLHPVRASDRGDSPYRHRCRLRSLHLDHTAGTVSADLCLCLFRQSGAVGQDHAGTPALHHGDAGHSLFLEGTARLGAFPYRSPGRLLCRRDGMPGRALSPPPGAGSSSPNSMPGCRWVACWAEYSRP